MCCGSCFFIKQLSLALESLDSFPVSFLRRAADLTMQTTPSSALTHPPIPANPVVSAVSEPGLRGTTHEGLPYFQVAGDAK